MPCSDKDDCKYQVPTNPLSQQQTTQTTTVTQKIVLLFVCVLAADRLFSSSFTNYSLALHVPVSLDKFPIYNVSFISEVYLSIWQPPKIS